VTTAASTASALQNELRSIGIIANEIGLYGRFHHEWYKSDVDQIIKFCESQASLHLPDASDLVHPTRSNSRTGLITSGGLTGHALSTILIQHSNWYQTFKAIYNSKSVGQQMMIKSFGPEKCVPPTIQREIQVEASTQQLPQARKPDDIAVLGMSIKVAGADDVAEFWDLLCAGKSQHKEVPPERIKFHNSWRELDPKRKWFGNFINNQDAFDHKFFKKSAREAASMDPQQRQLLQASYQALEQAGYFNSPDQEKRMGCYIGVCTSDYTYNVGCHQPNAFTATGNLTSFIAGKISHYFGWTGPALCIDTACSSSMVAVHNACKAILSGDCNAALAGGVNVLSDPAWFQNLAAASFLSPTGQCKPFDAKADGYCRGEGIAAVFLKKMSTAIADGDQILGTISSTAVFQNQNCTPIFVPNASSLSDMFLDVIDRSKLTPSQVTVVEAHGTGTQVGDPAEYDSIRRVLGGSLRSKPLFLGSAKGLVGHTEGTSGAVSLIKALLAIQQKAIPPQPSYDTPNPHLHATTEDKIEIVTTSRKWDDNFRAALINNYGASGSNASAVVTQAPSLPTRKAAAAALSNNNNIEFPFRFCAKSDTAIRDYLSKFRHFLLSNLSKEQTQGMSVENLAFNVCRQSNPTLERAAVLTARSLQHLIQKLHGFEKGEVDAVSAVKPTSRPVVLCFGGQISTYIGLSREVYDNVAIFRSYLNQCDAVCRSIGCESIFPGIFEKDPIADPVNLQTMLFATQYACARSWIDCGAQPVAVVGHSFGELVALCISGTLSLPDALKMIFGRANIIKASWGPEKGAMMAAEADLDMVKKLLAESSGLCTEAGEQPPTIACFNGPRSFTIAGSSKSLDIVIETISRSSIYSSSIRFKKLNVTNAFHSTFVEKLMTELEDVGKELVFKKPAIHLERATEFQTTEPLTPRYVAYHMRNPVYFSHAIQRLSKKYPSCIWLEAGSNSTITNMANRSLGSSPETFHCQSINITSDNGLQQLINAFTRLWKEGLNVTFWAHHRQQTYGYTPLILPSYQFDTSRHWLEPKPPVLAEEPMAAKQAEDEPKGLWSFVGYKEEGKVVARFRINTMTEDYMKFVSGHLLAQTAPICPATLELDIVVEALKSLCPDFATSNLQPKIYNVENQAAICIDPSRYVFLEVQAREPSCRDWDWKFVSNSSSSTSPSTLHVTGKTAFIPINDAELQSEFARYERLIGHQRCLALLNSNDADDIIQGRNIYNTFKEVVDYSEPYRGLQKLVGKGTESAGRVTKKYTGETWLDTLLADSFCQVGGIWVNCMTDTDPADMYIAAGIEKWIRSPQVDYHYARPQIWDIFCSHHRASDQLYLSDIFIFDPTNGNLVEAILGIKYHKVARASMRKILSRLTPSAASPVKEAISSCSMIPDEIASKPRSKEKKTEKKNQTPAGPDVIGKTRLLLAEIAGVEPEEIPADAQLADIGIDSLMGMELARELEGTFKITLPADDLITVVDFSQLVRLIQNTLGLPVDLDQGSDTSEDADTPESSRSEAGSVTTLSSTSYPGHNDQKQFGNEFPTAPMPETGDDLKLPASAIIEAFEKSKMLTDQFLVEFGCAGYYDTSMPKQTQLVVALTVEAFEQLGCPLRNAAPGKRLERIQYVPQHQRLVDYLYKMLNNAARLIDIDGPLITRTAIKAPSKSSEVLLTNLLRDDPQHAGSNRLTYYCGSRLADVLTGKCDGLKLIFGSEEGRELVTDLYANLLLNQVANSQMRDIIARLISKLPKDKGRINILEIGAGTGGTTKGMVAMLAKMNIPVEYTFTDISASFVAAARRNFKTYPFMKFRVQDIEKPLPKELIGTQHVIIASNCIHATHSLTKSTTNIRQGLRPDGFLMMQEMTEPIYWVDIIFGLLEGWWFFDDGRQHAITHQSIWERDLQSVGYGHIDWTDGHRPEVNFQRVFVALASGPKYNRQPLPPPPAKIEAVSTAARKAAVDDYVRKYTSSFVAPVALNSRNLPSDYEQCVLITGASGSLGAHLVAHIAALPQIKSIICLNRRNTAKPETRQQNAMEEKGIFLDPTIKSKIQVLQTDSAKPMLGLFSSEYKTLVNSVTHIIHNAWPMTAMRPLSGMESQFQVMRNLIDFAGDISSRRSEGFKVSFQFISSIAVVGHQPLWSGNPVILEERVEIDSVLPNGYGDAKYICERMLDETLHMHPSQFRTMSVRLGQIAGSKTSGYWNTMEHLSFLIKSSQTLKVLPEFEGPLSWTPVDDVAGTLSDILISDRTPYPVYHIDNPVRQPWREMLMVLADALEIPRANVIPFKQWISLVRSFPGVVEWDNPAMMVIDFLENNFFRMSCGGLILDTNKSCEHSSTLAAVGPVSAEVTRKYIQAWKDTNFLHS